MPRPSFYLASGLGLVAAGIVLPARPAFKAAALLAGGASAVWGASRAARESLEVLEEHQESGGAAGAIARGVLGSSENGVQTTIERPLSAELAQLKPKNLSRVVGMVLEPGQGEFVDRGLFEQNYPVRTVVANQSDAPRTARISLAAWEEFPIGSREIAVREGPRVTIPPRAEVETLWRMPVADNYSWTHPTVTLRLLWGGRKVGSVTFRRSRS